MLNHVLAYLEGTICKVKGTNSQTKRVYLGTRKWKTKRGRWAGRIWIPGLNERFEKLWSRNFSIQSSFRRRKQKAKSGSWNRDEIWQKWESTDTLLKWIARVEFWKDTSYVWYSRATGNDKKASCLDWSKGWKN